MKMDELFSPGNYYFGEESSVTTANEQGKGKVRGLKEVIKVRKEIL